MSTTTIAKTESSTSVIEQVLINGDLSKLSSQERLEYYNQVCQSVGLNPITRPFEYIILNNRLTLYVRKDATDQLRRLYNVSISVPEIKFQDDLVIVAVSATLPNGRTDSDLGVVSLGATKGDARGNLILKAVSKAKRRVTLSICGLGILDETEVEIIPTTAHWSEPMPPLEDEKAKLMRRCFAAAKAIGYTQGEDFKNLAKRAIGVESFKDVTVDQLHLVIDVLRQFEGTQITEASELDSAVYEAISTAVIPF